MCLLSREGRKEMFYLTTHSTHFIYGYMASDHSDSEKGNPLPPHGLLFPINSKGSFYASSHRQDSTYHGLCYTSREALAGTRNSSVGSTHRTMSERSYHGDTSRSLSRECIHDITFVSTTDDVYDTRA